MAWARWILRVSAPGIRDRNVSAIAVWDSVLKRGRAAGLFRGDVEATDLHAFVSALCLYRITNRATFKAIFDVDFADEETRKRHRALIVSMALEFLQTKPMTATA